MKKYFLLLIFAILLSIPAFAQSIERVIIATDITSVDALVAKAAGDKTGAPVLIAENGLLNDDVKSQLASLSVKTIILVGGPQVIKPAASDELQALGYTVIRLWGIERTGTAIEVAKYFWPSSNCAVLADDTKSSDADTDLQVQASSLASESECPLIPAPAGAAPAEVLALLNDLNVSSVKIIARVSPDASQLAKFTVKIIAGDKKKIETEVETEVEAGATMEGRKLKLVIVAAPSWKHALSIGAHPSERSVVRFVTDASQVAELITKIKDKNITDVRVVGIPALAQQIAAQLNASGITPKVVSGEKATKVAKEILDERKEKWNDKKKSFEEKRSTQLSRIKDKLLERLKDAEKSLNDQEVELESLKAEGADPARIAEIQAKIDTAKAKLSGLKADILSNSVDTTNRELAKLADSVNSRKWELRDTIKLDIRGKLRHEEERHDAREKEADDKISAIEARLAKLKEKCGDTAAVEELVAKAKSLREETKKSVQSGDHGKGSQFMQEVKRLVETAHRLGNVCEKEAKIADKLQNIVEKRVEKKIARTANPFLSIASPKDGETVKSIEVTVKVKVENFQLKPAGGDVKKGEGHLHYYLDLQELRSPKTEVTFANVTAGSHTIRVELHNNDHSMLSPAVIRSVNITTA